MEEKEQKPIFFYEGEFYSFSNFSSFAIEWKGKLWMTSEHVYQSEKFDDEGLKEEIRMTRSAHDSKKVAGKNKDKYRKNWDEIKLNVMEEILREKIKQHPYVMKKLIDSGDREIIEDSWRDDYWGWGPNKDGQNNLGKIWMKLREELQNK